MKSQDRDSRLTKMRKRSKEVAALLKHVSHAQRLLILCSLIEGEKSVGEIEVACGGSQSSVSQFLKLMRLEGLVDFRRHGKQVYYRITDDRVLDLMRFLYKTFCN